MLKAASLGFGTLDGVTIGSNLTQTGDLNITNGITLANGVTVDSGISEWYFGTGAGGVQHTCGRATPLPAKHYRLTAA